jgi:hypothetical protein
VAGALEREESIEDSGVVVAGLVEGATDGMGNDGEGEGMVSSNYKITR